MRDDGVNVDGQVGSPGHGHAVGHEGGADFSLRSSASGFQGLGVTETDGGRKPETGPSFRRGVARPMSVWARKPPTDVTDRQHWICSGTRHEAHVRARNV